VGGAEGATDEEPGLTPPALNPRASASMQADKGSHHRRLIEAYCPRCRAALVRL